MSDELREERSLLDISLEGNLADGPCGLPAYNCTDVVDVSTYDTGPNKLFMHGDCEPPNEPLRRAVAARRAMFNRDLYGLRFHGFAEGWFGRDSYACRSVECVGIDWIVCRDDDGSAEFLSFTSQDDMRSTLLTLAGKRIRNSARGADDDGWCCENPGPEEP